MPWRKDGKRRRRRPPLLVLKFGEATQAREELTMLLRGLTAAVTILLTQGLVSANGIAEKAAACSGCHGENGVPTGAGIPIIWGQNEDYISTELRDMKTGARRNSQMVAVLQDMSEDDILTLAAYFASKP
jgi:cytochrome c553